MVGARHWFIEIFSTECDSKIRSYLLCVVGARYWFTEVFSTYCNSKTRSYLLFRIFSVWLVPDTGSYRGI